MECSTFQSKIYGFVANGLGCISKNRLNTIRIAGGQSDGAHGQGLVRETLGEIAVSVNAPVTQKRPVRAGHVHFREVNWDEQVLFAVHAGFREDLPAGAGDEALAPELNAVAADGAFEADAVGDRDVAAVGDGMAAL